MSLLIHRFSVQACTKYVSSQCDKPDSCFSFGSIATVKLTCDANRVGNETVWPIYLSPTCSGFMFQNGTGIHGGCADTGNNLASLGVYSMFASCST